MKALRHSLTRRNPVRLLITFIILVTCSNTAWTQSTAIENEIVEYERQIQQKRSLLALKEQSSAQIEQETLTTEATLNELERRLQFLKTELNAIQVKGQNAKKLLDTAVANPELADIGKIETLRKEYQSASSKQKQVEEEFLSLNNQIEGHQRRLKDFKTQTQEKGREVRVLNRDILDLMLKKPVIVEGVGECVMHEEITVKACKEMAMFKAKQDAVEKGGASLVRSLTEVNLIDLKKDQLRVETAVRIRQVEILQPPSRVSEGELGKYVTRLRAVVQSLAEMPGQSEDKLKQPKQDQPMPSAPGLSPAGAFNLAHSDYLSGRYEQAITRFQQLLKDFPSTKLAASAHYYIGESYSGLLDSAKAAQAFERVVTDYPRHEKVPPSLYKLGILASQSGDVAKARGYFNRILEEFSTSDEAKLANQALAQLRERTRLP